MIRDSEEKNLLFKATTQTLDELERNVAESQERSLPEQGATYRQESSRHKRVAHNLPDFKLPPLGYSPSKKFFALYPELHLPALHPAGDLGTASFGADHLPPNELYLGDNLQVLRSLPSKSVDLIYIDPPFFSGRNYNLIWGDDNELRTFGDIWEDGLPSYLEWLNARLWEMARVLKDSGAIFVHCDWHASHYIKTEMDKIFGYEHFVNEIVWEQDAGQRVKEYFPRKHDVILYYRKQPEGEYTFNWWAREVRDEYNDVAVKMHFKKTDEFGAYREYANGKKFYLQLGKMMADVWSDISSQEASSPIMGQKIGYPTQKPESLLERIISAASDSVDTKVFKVGLDLFLEHEVGGVPGYKKMSSSQRDAITHNLTNRYILKEHATWKEKVDVSKLSADIVADFFVGGGTTCAVAQRLGRRFIGADVSNVAFDVTRSRLVRGGEELSGVKQNPDGDDRVVQEKMIVTDVPSIRLKYVGIYPMQLFENLGPEEFKKFVLTIVRARPSGTQDGITGYASGAGNQPILIGNVDTKNPIEPEQLKRFIEDSVKKYNQNLPVTARVFAWHFPSSIVVYAKELQRAVDSLVRTAPFVIELIPIDSPSFRNHVLQLYSDVQDTALLLSFVRNPVIASIEATKIKGRTWRLEAKGAQAWNPQDRLVNCQWDFDYQQGHFNAGRGAALMREKDKDSWRANFVVEYEFPKPGKCIVACKVQDSVGGEAVESVTIDVK